MRKRLIWALPVFVLFLSTLALQSLWIHITDPFPAADPEWIFLHPIQQFLLVLQEQDLDWALGFDLISPEYPKGALLLGLLVRLTGLSSQFLENPFSIVYFSTAFLFLFGILSSRDGRELLFFFLCLLPSTIVLILLTSVHPHTFCALLFLPIPFLLIREERSLQILGLVLVLVCSGLKHLGFIFCFLLALGFLFQGLIGHDRATFNRAMELALVLLLSLFFYDLGAMSEYSGGTSSHYDMRSVLLQIIIGLILALFLASVIKRRLQDLRSEKFLSLSFLWLIFHGVLFYPYFKSQIPGVFLVVSLGMFLSLLSLNLKFQDRPIQVFLHLVYYPACLVMYMLLCKEQYNPIEIIILPVLFLSSALLKTRKGRILFLLLVPVQLYGLRYLNDIEEPLPYVVKSYIDLALRELDTKYFTMEPSTDDFKIRRKVESLLSGLVLKKGYISVLALPEDPPLRYLFRPPWFQHDFSPLVGLQSSSGASRKMKLYLEWTRSPELFNPKDEISFYLPDLVISPCEMAHQEGMIQFFDASKEVSESPDERISILIAYELHRNSELKRNYRGHRISLLKQDRCVYLRKFSRDELGGIALEQQLKFFQKERKLEKNYSGAIRISEEFSNSPQFQKAYARVELEMKSLKERELKFEEIPANGLDKIQCDFLSKSYFRYPFSLHFERVFREGECPEPPLRDLAKFKD